MVRGLCDALTETVLEIPLDEIGGEEDVVDAILTMKEIKSQMRKRDQFVDLRGLPFVLEALKPSAHESQLYSYLRCMATLFQVFPHSADPPSRPSPPGRGAAPSSMRPLILKESPHSNV